MQEAARRLWDEVDERNAADGLMALAPHALEIVLDGELHVWDPEQDKYIGTGLTADRQPFNPDEDPEDPRNDPDTHRKLVSESRWFCWVDEP